ncbi:CIC11C00000004853 [Sungouiella intermedia]|uniref:CIC11C00000004853 n=1 Tax=Sungouiella intermedia TaxID=45354 RepID=A0A1L0G9Q6_9ASCO|nr:CIC11C00000004853 [[Candida] intermedia]
MNKETSSDSYGRSLRSSSDLHRHTSNDNHGNSVHSSDDQDVHVFTGHDDAMQPATRELSRTQTLLNKVSSRISFFNERLNAERISLSWKVLGIYGIMGFFILAIFSIYWGSIYRREYRYKNLRMLVVIEDEDTVNGIAPIIGETIRSILATPPAMALGKWLIQNTTEFNALAQRHNNSVFEEIQRQVHHQHYWSSIYVPRNATVGLYEAILAGDVSYNVSANTAISYYETGRDFLSMNQYVTPNVQRIQSMFLRHQQNITSAILGNSDLSQVFNNLNSLTVAATPMEWTFMDGRPFKDPVLLAPSQVGLIYMIIITFFSFNFFSDIHQSVAKMGIKIPHLVLYRILSAILSFFVISFFYSLVTLVFQVDFTRTFGHSGFIVYWMTNFLTMWAVGAMNEAMGMVFIMLYPPLLGFWMLFWVIVNISPTFAPLALSAKFFRYGYGMPIHASYEITKVIFFNTYKGALGRNYGILVAWCVIASVLLLVVFKKFGQVMGGRAAAQRAQIEKELNEKRARDEEGEIDFS